MRLRKESHELEEDDILLIASVSDALAHPARIKIYRFIMKANKERRKVCNKDVVEAFNYSQATISQHIKKRKIICTKNKIVLYCKKACQEVAD